jgi:hypothetical protein
MVAIGSTRSWRGGSGSNRKAIGKGGLNRENKKFRNCRGIDGP